MKYIACCVAIVVALFPAAIFAYDDESVHPAINENAAKEFVRHKITVLTDLGFADGLDEKLQGVNDKLSIKDWIKKGGTDEDSEIRVINHFHDPLQPSWNNSGFVGYSALIWAQDQSAPDDAPNQFTWKKARDKYYLALTSGSEQAFADTFLGLGHLMHLVSDMAVPSHVRLDPHLTLPWDWTKFAQDPDPFETWTKDQSNQLTYTGASVDSAIFSLAVASTAAPAPVSALWDHDVYQQGTNPSVTLTSGPMTIGLAEYTNANFFSKDTFTGYPYPLAGPGTLQNTDWIYPEEVVTEDGKRDLRVYYWDSVGNATIRKAGTSLITLDVMAKNTNPPWQIDDNVSHDYASLLVPAAVGYSTALLDYFFRGDIDSITTIPASADRINFKEMC